MDKTLLFIGLMITAMGIVQCSREKMEAQQPESIWLDPLSIDLEAGHELYVADIIWEYTTEHELQFGNFEPKTVSVQHRVEDAYVFLVLDREPTLEDFTAMTPPPYPGAAAVAIQVKRRWPRRPR